MPRNRRKASRSRHLSQKTNVGNGNNWQVKEWSYLVIQTNTVVVMGESTKQKWFTKVGSTYVPQFSTRETLVLDTVNNVYELIDLQGGVTKYVATTGAFQSYTDPYGIFQTSDQFIPPRQVIGTIAYSF